MEFTFDPREFAPVIQSAVTAAIRRIRDELLTDPIGNLLLDKRQAAEALSVSVSTLDRQTYPKGDLRAVRLDNRVLYSPDSIRQWIGKRERNAE